MSSQWLILLTFISFLQLAVTGYINRPAIDTDFEDGTHKNVDVIPNNHKVGVISNNENADVTSNDDNVDVVPNNENVDVTSTIGISGIGIDTSYYYRLTNTHSGSRLALDVINDGSNYGIKMAPISSNSGQFWRFVHLGNNVYSLRTLFLKYQYSLDIANDKIKTKPHMAKTGDYIGQRWHITRLGDGTFKLNNEFSGNNMVLDVSRDTHMGYMSNRNADYSGQHWSFTKIRKVNIY